MRATGAPLKAHRWCRRRRALESMAKVMKVMMVDDAYSELKLMESILRSTRYVTKLRDKEVFVRLIVSLRAHGPALEHTEART
jgi:hypothetical protein